MGLFRRVDGQHLREEYEPIRALPEAYLSAVKTLAQARKTGPVVQIDIAEKQIDTAG